MLSGWWKFHRAMENHAVWTLPASHFKLWITCLCLANHDPGEWWNGTERLQIPAGSFVTSLDHLAKRANITKKQVRTGLVNLNLIGSIKAQFRAHRYTHIFIVNWETYNGTDAQEGTVEGIRGAQQGHSEGTSGRMKEEILTLPVATSGNGKHPKKSPDPNVKLLIDFWYQAYVARFKAKPPVNGAKSGALAKKLLAGRTLDEARWLIEEHIRNPLDFYERKCLYSLEHILSAAPQLLARRAVREEVNP